MKSRGQVRSRSPTGKEHFDVPSTLRFLLNAKHVPLNPVTILAFMCRKMSGMAAQRDVAVQQKLLAQRNVRMALTADRSAA